MSDKPETISDIIAAMRTRADSLSAGHLRALGCDYRSWSDRLEAAYKRELGNAQKMREALENCANMGEQIDCLLGISDATVYAFRHERCLAHNISECALAALAAPPRNCDVGTADEHAKRFYSVCKKYKLSDGACEASCPMQMSLNCALAWAQMPYEKERRNHAAQIDKDTDENNRGVKETRRKRRKVQIRQNPSA